MLGIYGGFSFVGGTANLSYGDPTAGFAQIAFGASPVQGRQDSDAPGSHIGRLGPGRGRPDFCFGFVRQPGRYVLKGLRPEARF